MQKKPYIPKREIKIYVPKDLKILLKDRAEKTGESMNVFINRAILAALESEKEN